MISHSTVAGRGFSDQRLDAIVVPTNRSPECLDYTLELARATDALLLILCSGRALAIDVAKRISSHGVRGLAVDVPEGYGKGTAG